jgi:hypothetical protein
MLHLLAHAGHGKTDGTSLLHWLTEPVHLPYTLAAAALIVAIAVWSLRRKREA